jgi:peptide/nickel transport system permease protein
MHRDLSVIRHGQRRMMRFLGRRALHSAVALCALVMLVFFLVRLTGDPANLYLPIDASIEQRQAFSERHGFDRPVLVQFAAFVGDILSGEFGVSIRKERPALEVVLQAFPTTLSLAVITMALAVSLAVAVGSLAACRPGGAFDRLATLGSLGAASAPDFWVAITGILVFAVALGWLPTSGTGDWRYWVLPVTVLMLRPFGLLVQVVRGAMLNALSSAYVKTARAKGVGEASIVFVHALRNSALTVVTVAGDQMVGIVNGAVIVETVFGWPGVGKLMIDAVMQRDFVLVQATILITATAIFLLNILIDILYVALDPRIRHQ